MLRAVILMLGVLAVVAMGGSMTASAVDQAGAAPPCHEAPAPHAPSIDPSDKAPPGVMSCCIACAAYAAPAFAASPLATPDASFAPRPALDVDGRNPAPEPGPPRA